MKTRNDLPLTSKGLIDDAAWLASQDKLSRELVSELAAGLEVIRNGYVKHESPSYGLWKDTDELISASVEMVQILLDLELEDRSLIAALLYWPVKEDVITQDVVAEKFGALVSKQLEGVFSMAAISQSRAKAAETSHLNRKDNLRKMLVAMTDDVRIALIKLSERLIALRSVKYAAQLRQEIAIEVSEVYAPLAHRLGVAQLKWELEDFSFRYLKPQEYKSVAKSLDERRIDREEFIREAKHDIEHTLKENGIEADVSGRAKHIYSIWRKMQLKNYQFEQLYDIRAFRILVDTLPQCYSVLGLVHALYKHIPHQFDDYITNPKPNGYRSLHTAVFGPHGKPMEVQIRTHDMHREAELGVCAHWKYKGTDAGSKQSSYEAKLEWLREVLEWQETIDGDLDDESAIEADRIYIFSKAGDVVDLPAGSTPLDFAYRIHSDVGNRCKGAKVAGRIVPLNTTLTTGDQVEILTAKNAKPSRDWLNPESGYITTSRARAKVIHFFKNEDRDENISYGRQAVESELKRLRISHVNLSELAVAVNYKDAEGMYAAVGAGDLRTSQVSAAAQRLTSSDDHKLVEESETPSFAKAKPTTATPTIEGLDQLKSFLASCCHPLPGDEITGYITLNRGVSIHRSSCKNLANMRRREPARIIDVNWGGSKEENFVVDIEVTAQDKPHMLRDLIAAVSEQNAILAALNVIPSDNSETKHLTLSIQVLSLEHLDRVLNFLVRQHFIDRAERSR